MLSKLKVAVETFGAYLDPKMKNMTSCVVRRVTNTGLVVAVALAAGGVITLTLPFAISAAVAGAILGAWGLLEYWRHWDDNAYTRKHPGWKTILHVWDAICAVCGIVTSVFEIKGVVALAHQIWTPAVATIAKEVADAAAATATVVASVPSFIFKICRTAYHVVSNLWSFFSCCVYAMMPSLRSGGKYARIHAL